MVTAYRVRGLNKSFRRHQVLRDINFDIQTGEMVAIVGPSGSGKSTLLNVLGGLEDRDSGDVSLHSKPLPKAGSKASRMLLRREIGYLFQNFALIDGDTVDENLRLAQRFAVSRGSLRRAEVLQEVGLANFGSRHVYELSGGEQQRVALARLMLKPCSLILADEPTGSLDAMNRDVVIDALRVMVARGKTVLVVTHDDEVATRCDRKIVLEGDVSGSSRRGNGAEKSPRAVSATGD